MKTFENTSAQGDVYFRYVDAIPNGVKKVEPVNGRYIIAHSETGHHHVMGAEHVTMYESDNPLVCFLYVEQPATLEHLRSFDTHEPIMFRPGYVEVRRAREWTPAGFRRSQD